MGKLILEPSISPPKTEIYFGFRPEICLNLAKQGAILVDTQIAKMHGTLIQKTLGYELILVPSGEKHKTRETKQALEDELLKRNLGHDSLLVGMGGGVTTDLVGFVASTYMRGIPLVFIPTTLLAMVDAAIGGKTSVDTPFGKNLIGTFYLPKAIFIDINFLKSLPEKEMKNGLSEILKYGLIANTMIWEKCDNWQKEIPFLVQASIACKIKIVEQDFEEKTGLRRILNFGHTIGHALELVSHFQMAHGEAVALGCMAESYLSHLLGFLPDEILQRILNRYQTLGYSFQKFDTKAFLHALTMDKKAKGGEPRFVAIDRIGHCVSFNGEYCTPVRKGDLERMVEWMHHG